MPEPGTGGAITQDGANCPAYSRAERRVRRALRTGYTEGDAGRRPGVQGDETSMAEGRARRSGAAELERRNRELSILNAIASALNSTVDLNEALHAALAQVAALLDLHTGWIWLLDEETYAPYLAASQDLPPGLANYPRRMEGSCYCLDTYQAGDLGGAANVNVVTCTRLKGLVDGANGLRYHASIPPVQYVCSMRSDGFA